MLKPVRRVVTGHNAEGRSVVISDDVVEPVFELPHWPGRGLTPLWVSDRMPASNEDDDLDKTIPGADYTLNIGSGIVALMIEQIPPESDLDTMTPERRAEATAPLSTKSPSAIEVDLTKSSLMHATDTADCAVLLSGQLTMLLDEVDVDLKPGDAVIQRGTNHALVNRGTEPALLACLIMDAVPLRRRSSARPASEAQGSDV